jgi:hypothetical protein
VANEFPKAPRPCCREKANREPYPLSPDPKRTGKWSAQKCKVCGLRHFELEVDPLNFRLPLSGLR